MNLFHFPGQDLRELWPVLFTEVTGWTDLQVVNHHNIQTGAHSHTQPSLPCPENEVYVYMLFEDTHTFWKRSCRQGLLKCLSGMSALLPDEGNRAGGPKWVQTLHWAILGPGLMMQEGENGRRPLLEHMSYTQFPQCRIQKLKKAFQSSVLFSRSIEPIWIPSSSEALKI